jgi:homoserine O-acetyltransferase
VAFYDNVRAQHELVTKHFGITHLRAVLGWSMGAGQTYQWVTQYPDFMDIAVPFCGSAKTSLHNQVFIEGVKVALLAVKNTRSAGSGKGGLQEDSAEVRTWSERDREIGLKAMGRVYAGWWVHPFVLLLLESGLSNLNRGFSQAFYRQKLYETALGYKDLEDFLQNHWEKWACSKGKCATP